MATLQQSRVRDAAMEMGGCAQCLLSPIGVVHESKRLLLRALLILFSHKRDLEWTMLLDKSCSYSHIAVVVWHIHSLRPPSFHWAPSRPAPPPLGTQPCPPSKLLHPDRHSARAPGGSFLAWESLPQPSSSTNFCRGPGRP